MSSEDMKKDEVRDSYLEHELHKEVPDPECSLCWNELKEHECLASDSSPGGGSELCPICRKYAGIVTD